MLNVVSPRNSGYVNDVVYPADDDKFDSTTGPNQNSVRKNNDTSRAYLIQT